MAPSIFVLLTVLYGDGHFGTLPVMLLPKGTTEAQCEATADSLTKDPAFFAKIIEGSRYSDGAVICQTLSLDLLNRGGE